MSKISYDWPEAAYLILIAFVIIVLFWRLAQVRKQRMEQYAAEPLLPHVVSVRSRLYYTLYVIGIVGAWTAATLALMQPKGNGRYASMNHGMEQAKQQRLLEETVGEEKGLRKRKAQLVIFLIDTSASMEVKDTRTGISRLDSAKEIIDETIGQLDGQEVALYAFTSEATPIAPATLDYLYTRLITRQVKINEGDVAGTDLLEALETLKQKYFKIKNLQKTVILLTDGGDTRFESLQGEQQAQELQAILNQLAGSEEESVRLYTVGMGSKEGAVIPGISFEGNEVKSSLNEGLLMQLSEKGRGRYYFANQFSTLKIAQEIAEQVKADSAPEYEEEVTQRHGRVERIVSKEQELVFDWYYRYPLFVAIVLLATALLLPERKSRKKPAANVGMSTNASM